MSKRNVPSKGGPKPGSYERGAGAASTELSRLIPYADAACLRGVLDNPALTVQHLPALLMNRRFGARHAESLARDPRFGGLYDVRAALANHPATPPALAMNLVSFLFWRDLAKIAENFRLYPPLRRRAEILLSERLSEMTEGEIAALARIASRPLIKALRRPERPRVIAALLENPRVVEEDVLAICRAPKAPPQSLAAVALSGRWGGRRSVRVALASNPATPIQDSLRCLQGLLSSDLESLSRDDLVPRIVRIGAERRLVGRSPSGLRRSRPRGPDAPPA